MPHDDITAIVLRVPRTTKGIWVAAARREGKTLFDWLCGLADGASADERLQIEQKTVVAMPDEQAHP
jgi:hypothetical protein